MSYTVRQSEIGAIKSESWVKSTLNFFIFELKHSADALVTWLLKKFGSPEKVGPKQYGVNKYSSVKIW
ncbi:MAG: hypothetical protein ACRCY5_04580 [Phocaeicola sp.]